METQIEQISPVECRVRVEIPWKDVSGRLNTKLGELRRKARLPGFRPGKVPPRLIEKMFGKSVRQELVGELVQETFQTAVAQHNAVALTQPVVESSSLERGQPFTYAARFEVPPQIEPKDYTGVAVTRRPARVDEDKVEAELSRLQDEHTELLPVPEDETDKPSVDGDVWTVDVEGSVGTMNVSRKDVRAEMGSEQNEYIPGLAAALAGTSRSEVGSVKSLSFVPPEDRMREEFRGQAAKISVGLRDVRIKRVPERDDELARDTGEAETFSELDAKIRKSVEEADAVEAERDARRALVATLLERNDVDPAPSMVAREVQAQVDATKQQLAQQGLDLARVGTTESELVQQMRPQALFNVSAYLLLDAIGKKEDITVPDDELNEEVEKIAEERGQNLARTRATLEKDGQLILLRAQLREEKILDFLMEKANVTEAEPEVAGGDQPSAAGGTSKKKSTKKKAAKKKAKKKSEKATVAAAAGEAADAKGAKKAGAKRKAADSSGAKTTKKKSQGSRRHRRKADE